ncbi:zinc finger protein 91-like [Dreissena polymorpha]|uniref:C2H2-type domain-containing protein n=1 Tax=Dreissena polymorpha TaxID=45954 RepID=A0A9D4IUB9_DREPO|nr:zinc finger protein 91-like [Dreissena polymorpha]XP_052225257.1 zinc finger protein 91-like [Dreissena polymorpha]XP_052225258.1 zinc finger protein 91-like [Dreissena polymorpha]KAH3785077.1 hypothetical protein DPMN_163160 [Dreissena polymorpha]
MNHTYSSRVDSPSTDCHKTAPTDTCCSQQWSQLAVEKDGRVSCKLCWQLFQNIGAFKVHCEKHFGRKYSCSKCEKRFSSLCAVKSHEKLHDVSVKQARPWQCDRCPMAYQTKQHLKRHIIVHTGARNFVCHLCGKDFLRQHSLQKHIKVVHMEVRSQYTCNLCGNNYKTKFSLSTHLKIHRNQRDYMCGICLRSFVQKKPYLDHMEKHKKNSGTKRKALFVQPSEFCHLCPKTFANATGLKRHLRKHELGLLKRCKKFQATKKVSDMPHVGEASTKESSTTGPHCSSTPDIEMADDSKTLVKDTSDGIDAVSWIYYYEKDSAGPTDVKTLNNDDKKKGITCTDKSDKADYKNRNRNEIQCKNSISHEHVHSATLNNNQKPDHCNNANNVHVDGDNIVKETTSKSEGYQIESNEKSDSARESGATTDDVSESLVSFNDRVVEYHTLTGMCPNENRENPRKKQVINKARNLKQMSVRMKSVLTMTHNIGGSDSNVSKFVKGRKVHSGKTSRKCTGANRCKHLAQWSMVLFRCPICAIKLKRNAFVKHFRIHDSLSIYCKKCSETQNSMVKFLWHKQRCHRHKHGKGNKHKEESVPSHKSAGSVMNSLHQVVQTNSLAPRESCDSSDVDSNFMEVTHEIVDRTKKQLKSCKSKCQLCDKILKSRPALMKHLLEIHNQRKSLQCERCDKSFVSVSGYNKHKKKHIPGSSEEIMLYSFKCKICNKSYTTNDRLKTHMLVHAESKPFQCSTCGNTFTQHTHLLRHSRVVHQKVKDVPCPVCGKMFADKWRIKSHMRSHTGECPYTCEQCGKSFRSTSALQTHIKTRHQNRRFQCSTCGACFTAKNRLMLHMKRHDLNKQGDSNASDHGAHVIVNVQSSVQKSVQCSFCDKTFKSQKGLKMHQKNLCNTNNSSSASQTAFTQL